MATRKPNPDILLVILTALFCFIVLPQRSCGDEPSLLFKTYHVHIVSGLVEYMPPVQVHCLTEKHDLGTLFLHPSQEYLIRFKVDYFRRTRVTCLALWDNKLTEFTAFKCSRDENWCASGNCFWSIRTDGFYFSKDNQTWDREYQWLPKRPSSTLGQS